MQRRGFFVFVLLTVFVTTIVILSIRLTKKADSASLTAAKVTLANSRMSYKARVATGTSGSSVVTINGGAYPDPNTNHLFPGDVLCFTDEGINGCIGNKTYTVSNIISGTSFNLTTALTDNLDTSGFAVASQSGTWTVSFTTVGQVPNGGSILITIPEADNIGTKGNDGIPDSAGSVETSGFDLNNLATGGVTITGCTPANWGTPVVTPGPSGTTDHTISIPRITDACAASTAIVVTIGSSAPSIVNPAPITGHAQGTADVYGITVQTKDGGSNVIDSAIPRAAPVEAVLISATIDESLSLTVNYVTGSDLYANPTWCGTIPSAADAKTTTVTSIPWGHLATPNHFYYAAQQLTVSTNAASGYVVTIEENDQMGKNGNTCTSTSPSGGNHYTFVAGTCIRDTVCAAGACSESTAADWVTASSFPGLGYSLASQSGTDAPFFFDEKTRTWSAKQLADKTEGGETAAIIMSNAAPVSGSSIYVCYKLTIPGTQPAGYYYNIAKYTATVTF